MAMSHRDCDHEVTPQARAKCRSMQAALDAGVANSKRDHQFEGSVKGTRVPNSRIIRLDASEPLAKRRQKAVRAAAAELATTRTKPAVSSRTRVLRAEHDLADVPHAFGTIIRWAWDHGHEVKTGLPFNETERQIIISSDNGWLTLVWRSGQPYGVTAIWWRPSDTSVQYRVMTVQQGLTALESGEWE